MPQEDQLRIEPVGLSAESLFRGLVVATKPLSERPLDVALPLDSEYAQSEHEPGQQQPGLAAVIPF